MLSKLNKYKFNKKNIAKVPKEPGIYVFLREEEPLYVGKSVNLRARVASYKLKSLTGKTAILVSETKYFSYIIVNSEIEALLLEAKLVNKLQTPFNIQLKDDKHPLYIRITNDKYPLVLTSRKISAKEDNLAFFGPFPSTVSVKKTLSLLRKIFPFAQHFPGKRACIYSQMGLCSPCPSDIEKSNSDMKRIEENKKYLRNIRMLIKFLNGDIKKVKKQLNRKMRQHTKLENFEEAAKIKSKLDAVEYITQPTNSAKLFLQNPDLIEDIKEKEVNILKSILSKYFKIESISRIECYDVAHLSGTFPTASMVTFIDATPEKAFYRHFKIRQNASRDDISNLKEVAKRRKKHLTDWGKPDLIIIDGGKGQVRVFLDEFAKLGIPVIGIAKRNETLIIPKMNNVQPSFLVHKLENGPALNLVQRLRNEAHRFARRLHHNLVKKELFQNN